MSNSLRLSETAVNFEYFLDKKTGNWRVSWYDRETDGTLVRHYDPQPFRKEARARERVHQLRREVGKLGPSVRLCPHRNLYVLHVYVDGRLVRRSLGTRDADEIPARMEKALAKLGLGKAVSSVTVRQFIDRYLIENLDDARLKTRYRTIRTIKVFEEAFGAERNIYSLTQDDVERFVKQRVLTYKPNSVNTEISVWNAAVNYHRKKNLFPAGKTVPTMERVQVPQTEKLLLTETDFDLIFEAARDWRKTRARKTSNRERPSSLEIYLKMVRYSGGRSCFYDDLLWSQVDLENGFINFAVPGVIYKRNKRRPTVPIAAELRPYLERLQQLRQPGEDHVLWQRGRAISQKLARLAQIAFAESDNARLRELAPLLHSHAFRRAYITWAISKGISASLVARVTGNSAQVIEDHYFAYRPDMGRSVVDAV